MRFRLYGLNIDSHDLLFEVAPAKKTNVDVRVKHASPRISHFFSAQLVHELDSSRRGKMVILRENGRGYLLRFNELADFTIDRIGSEIDCMPRPGIPEDTIQHLLLDQVIPLVINLRGGEALHASAILASYGVVAFAGPAGSGKSTITASLMKMGYPFVSDDCLTLRERDQTILAIPAYPGLRLWDDAQEHLFGEKGYKKSVAHYTRKLRVDIEERPESYSPEPKPFVRLYDIVNSSETDETSNIMIEKLSPRDSFMALVRCAFRLDITDQQMLSRQFQFLKGVTSKISVRRLSFPRNFRILPDVQKAILNDLKDLGE